jgi:hypothetical protein
MHDGSFRGERRWLAAPAVGWLGFIIAQIEVENNGFMEIRRIEF